MSSVRAVTKLPVYSETIAILDTAGAVLTALERLQKEAFLAEDPCTTIRRVTE
ncbi:MAG: hypothetical protein ABSD99_05075 [Candidatus Bathyarchaeia archaeon]|jgi:hypothetical protein